MALSAALALLVLSSATHGAGREPFNFLFLDGGARAAAMGGAYTAVAAGADALHYNPAGLAAVPRHQLTFMHNQYFAGITQEYAAYASPYGWGAYLNSMDFGDAPRTTYSNPSGSGLGDVGMSGLALAMGYGRTLLPGLSAGGALKYLRESVAGHVGQGAALDAGVLYEIPLVEGLRLGGAMQNLGPTVRYQSAKENLPFNMRCGAAYAFSHKGHGGTLSADVSKARSEGALLSLGAETAVTEMFLFRAGYSMRNQAGLGMTLGLGWSYRAWTLDYAFVPYGELGMAHRVGGSFSWGGRRAASRSTLALPGWLKALLRRERRSRAGPTPVRDVPSIPERTKEPPPIQKSPLPLGSTHFDDD